MMVRYLPDIATLVLDKRIWHVFQDGSICNRYWKKMSQYSDKDGYKYILTKVGGHRKKYLVHRLVALAYIPNPDGLPQINHINGDKADNRVANLEWVTNSQNQTHSRYVLGNKMGFTDMPVTVGSLFDGIGGFPLVFSRAGGIPIWASEIEPFCIEVTKRRFG